MNHEHPTNEPRALSPEDAAALLMRKAHIVFLGDRKIAEHRKTLEDIMNLGLEELRYFVVTSELKWHAGPTRVMLVEPRADPALAEYVFLFVPDNLLNRLAMVVVMLATGGPRALEGITSENAEAPIVVLGDPEGDTAGQERLNSGYRLVCEGMKAIAEGKALNTLSN